MEDETPADAVVRTAKAIRSRVARHCSYSASEECWHANPFRIANEIVLPLYMALVNLHDEQIRLHGPQFGKVWNEARVALAQARGEHT